MLLRDPQGHPLSWASNTHLLPLRLPWPRVLPDWLQPENTKVGVACTNWRQGGRSWWEHQGLVGGRAQRVCSLLVSLPSGPVSPASWGLSFNPYSKHLLEEETKVQRGPLPSQGHRQGGGSLCRALWVGPQPTAPGAPRVGQVLAGPAESRGAWASLGLGSLEASGRFCVFIRLRSPLAQALPEC